MQEGEKHLRFFKKSFGRLADFRYMYSESKTLPPGEFEKTDEYRQMLEEYERLHGN